MSVNDIPSLFSLTRTFNQCTVQVFCLSAIRGNVNVSQQMQEILVEWCLFNKGTHLKEAAAKI